MKKILALIALIYISPSFAYPVNDTPPWQNFQVNTSVPESVSASIVTRALTTKVNAINGQAQGLTLDPTSTISGQSAASVGEAVSALHTPRGVDANFVGTQALKDGSVKRAQLERNRDTKHLYDYCPLTSVDGKTDNTACFQLAVYAVCDGANNAPPWRAGGDLYLPPGTITLSHISLSCNGIRLIGAGNGNVNSGNLDYRGTIIRSVPGNTGTMFQYTSTNADYGDGLSVAHLAIDASNMAPGGTLFDFSWLQHSTIRDVSIRNPYNFYREEGGAANLVEDVVISGLRGIGVEFWGDASQCGDLASCNRRADLLRVNRVNINAQPNTVGTTCYYYHDFAQSLDVTTTTCESAYWGLHATCSASMGHNGEACPAFARFYDAEFEDCVFCVVATDIQDWEFFGGYMLGTGLKSPHVASFGSQNFGQGSYAQAVRIHGGRYGNSAQSALSIGLDDVIVQDAQFFASNLAQSASPPAPQIEITAPSRHGIISDNLLCVASGQQPAGQVQGAVTLDAGVSGYKVHDNVTTPCTSGVVDNGSGNTVHDD